MRRKRLLILSNGIYPHRMTGTPFWCGLIAGPLSAIYDVTVFACRDDALVPPCAPIELWEESFHTLGWRELPGTYGDPIRQHFRPETDPFLQEQVRRVAPDMVLALNFAGHSSTIVAHCLEEMIPVFFFVNDVAPFCFEGYFNDRERGTCFNSEDGRDCSLCLERRIKIDGERTTAIVDAHRRYGQALARSFSGVAAPTEWFLDRLIKETCGALDRSSCIRIPYGLPRYGERTRKPDSKEEITLGFYGGSDPRKGGDCLALAMEKISRENPRTNLRLRWYGGPPPMSARVRRLMEGGWIDQVGLVSSDCLIEDMLSLIDVSVIPSRGEVLPLVALQSLRCGVPVVISALGGIDEIVRNGENGFLIQPGDPDALVDIISLISNREVDWSVGRYEVTDLEESVLLLREMLESPRPVRIEPKEFLYAVEELQTTITTMRA